MSQKTLGQEAYEAQYEALFGDGKVGRSGELSPEFIAFERNIAKVRQAWEFSAAAVVAAHEEAQLLTREEAKACETCLAWDGECWITVCWLKDYSEWFTEVGRYADGRFENFRRMPPAPTSVEDKGK